MSVVQAAVAPARLTVPPRARTRALPARTRALPARRARVAPRASADGAAEEVAKEVKEALDGSSLFLVGMMGTGKSSVGKKLAASLGYSFFDTDEVIEQVTKTSIPTIFAESGEDGFREIETQVLAEIAAYKKCVVATGGGVVKKKANWMHLRNGVVLCLTGTPTLLAARITRDGAETRPLFKDVGDDVDAIAGKIEEMMKERAPMYANADVQVRLAEAEDAPGVEGETLDELNVRIMRCVRKRIEDDDTKDRLRSEPKPGDITITGA